VTAHDAVFVLVGLVTAGAAVLMVTSKNLVHAALHLAVTLAGIAGVFFVLHADFLGLTQLLVYVGAVAVLFLFGLMLTRAPIGREALDSQHRGLGLLVAGGLFATLSALIVHAFAGQSTAEVTGPAVGEIGVAIFRDWVLPFELLSMLLLAALIGSIVLARREDGESGEVAEQTLIDFGDAPSTEGDRVVPLDAGPRRPELTSGRGGEERA
jgi:NADH-quinone oxidoreductase subunit J